MSGRIAVAVLLLANVAELAKTDWGYACKRPARAHSTDFLPQFRSLSLSLRTEATLRGGGSRCLADQLVLLIWKRMLSRPINSYCECRERSSPLKLESNMFVQQPKP